MDEELSEYATIRFTNRWSSIGLVHRPSGAPSKLRPVVGFIYLGFRFLCLFFADFRPNLAKYALRAHSARFCLSGSGRTPPGSTSRSNLAMNAERAGPVFVPP